MLMHEKTCVIPIIMRGIISLQGATSYDNALASSANILLSCFTPIVFIGDAKLSMGGGGGGS